MNSGEAGLDPSLSEKRLVEMKVGRPCSALCGCGIRHQIGGRCSQSQREAKVQARWLQPFLSGLLLGLCGREEGQQPE